MLGNASLPFTAIEANYPGEQVQNTVKLLLIGFMFCVNRILQYETRLQLLLTSNQSEMTDQISILQVYCLCVQEFKCGVYRVYCILHHKLKK